MDFRGRRHERGSNWTDPEIVELLQLWSDDSVQVELESSLRNQRVFDRIAHVLRDKGILRTGDQCREKIKKMKLEYRRIKDNHKMRSWKFYDVMDRVLAHRPAVAYSSLGGAVIAQQVFQSPAVPEAYLQGVPPGAFGPASAGGFLFGRPPQPEDPLGIKCEDVDESLLDSCAAPPEMYYGSGDDRDTDGQSPEDALGPGEGPALAGVSPSGLSGANVAGPATAATQTGPFLPNAIEPSSKEDGSRSSSTAGQRKRRRRGKTAWHHRGARCGARGSLDRALASFLNWQRAAEERLLSLEESRLERELQAEERREQQEERRAEQERQHELRLFSMLTGALVSVGQAASPSVRTDTDLCPSPQRSTVAAPSVSSLSSQLPPEGPVAQAAPPAHEATATLTPPASVKACRMSPMVSSAAQGAAGDPSGSVYLSSRGNSIRQRQGLLERGFAQYGMDAYHDTDNPDGIINLGTSENNLCYDILHKRLTKPDMLHIDPSLLQYSDSRGHAFLREAVATFLTHYCRSPKPLDARNVVVANGCGSLFSCIAAVICDPKDAILIPTPFYGNITQNVRLYGDVQLFHVPLDCEDGGEESRPFRLTVAKLEAGLERSKREGLAVRAVILINPHNPLADVYTLKETLAFLEFAKRNELHAIVDELYMLTVFDEALTFHSVLSVDSLPDPQRTHVMWGLSKDFALAGLRVGTLYTENADVVEAVAQLATLHRVPGPTQHQAAQLLRDTEWISEEFLPENRSRLKAAHGYLTGELRSLGIPYLDRPAALYVWADLRKYLTESTFDEELSMWSAFLGHKLVLSCGQAFYCSTPGWFRIIFAHRHEYLRLGLKRFREALEGMEAKSASPRSHSIRDASDGSEKSVKVDSEDLDNGAIVDSESAPQSESSDQLREKDAPVPDTGAAAAAAEEFVLLDCQASKHTESLDSLIGALKHQIGSSDWLEKNTPELSAGEDPEILDVFTALLQRARK